MSVLPQPAAPRSAPDAPHIGVTDSGEEVISNGRSGDARISVCIPTWRDSSDALLGSLVRMAGADQCTLLIFDDGSHDPALTRQLTRQIMRFPGPARLVCAPRNCGRSHARNRLFALAETEWVLFLDADMQPDDADFVNRYLDAIDAEQTPSLIAGGFSLTHAHPTDETKLHAEQSRTSECVPASLRADAPGRYVFTSNILVHRQVLTDIAFDPEFQGWGWEDVDWGLRVAERYPIIHIDNQATHLGLDTDEKLLSKYANSVDNFLRLLDRHPDEMSLSPLYRAARQLSRLPGLRVISNITRRVATNRRLPVKVRLTALKIFRASIYGTRL
ncbi:MAG: glycosyltransferase family 2 protein [Pseudomonadota bacterium]